MLTVQIASGQTVSAGDLLVVPAPDFTGSLWSRSPQPTVGADSIVTVAVYDFVIKVYEVNGAGESLTPEWYHFNQRTSSGKYNEVGGATADISVSPVMYN